MKSILWIGITAISFPFFAFASNMRVDIQDVNLRKTEFDMRKIIVRGYLVVGPESMYVTTRKDYVGDFWKRDSGCLSLLNTGNLGAADPVENGRLVTVVGIFHASNYDYGISMSECGVTGIDLGGNPSENIELAE